TGLTTLTASRPRRRAAACRTAPALLKQSAGAAATTRECRPSRCLLSPFGYYALEDGPRPGSFAKAPPPVSGSPGGTCADPASTSHRSNARTGAARCVTLPAASQISTQPPDTTTSADPTLVPVTRRPRYPSPSRTLHVSGGSAARRRWNSAE